MHAPHLPQITYVNEENRGKILYSLAQTHAQLECNRTVLTETGEQKSTIYSYDGHLAYMATIIIIVYTL